ncbi:hypothetical protein ACI3ER_11575 [Bacillus sp. Wb]
MKGNYIADQYEMLIIDKNGVTIVKDKMQSTKLDMEEIGYIVNGESLVIKTSYTVVNNEDNKDFYSLIEKYIGKVITLKSKGLDGNYSVSKEDGDLVITKVAE